MPELVILIKIFFCSIIICQIRWFINFNEKKMRWGRFLITFTRSYLLELSWEEMLTGNIVEFNKSFYFIVIIMVECFKLRDYDTTRQKVDTTPESMQWASTLVPIRRIFLVRITVSYKKAKISCYKTSCLVNFIRQASITIPLHK